MNQIIFKQSFLKRLKIGMRIIKTVVAVFICCIIDYFRGVPPFQSTIAAIICIQPDTENSVNMAASRILATLLGSVTATLLLLILSRTNIVMPSISFYLILSLLLIPLISITVKMGWPSATALTCIIFLSITLGYDENSNIFMEAVNSLIDTLVGILVALPINALLPNRLASSVADVASEIENTKAPQNSADEDQEDLKKQ